MLDKLFEGEGRTTPRNQIRAAATGSDDARPEPSEQQIEPDKVATAEKRSRKPVETVEEWPSREAVAAARGKRLRPAPRATEKQRSSPAVETTALGPTVQKRTKQNAPRLRGAPRVGQGQPEERLYFT